MVKNSIETEIQRSILKRMKEEAKNISSLSNRYLSLVLWQIKTKKSFSFILWREIKNVVQQAFMIVYRTKIPSRYDFFYNNIKM